MSSRYSFYRALGAVAKTLGREIDSPVFVIGTGRCGSTLLSGLLRSHRGLTVFPTEGNELWFPGAYPIATATIETPPLFEQPKAFTQNSLRAWPPNHANVIRSVLRGCALSKGWEKPFLLKSAMISFMVPTLIELYPKARFVHIYRHALAFMESQLKKNWDDYVRLSANPSEREFRAQCARYWCECIDEIDRAEHEFGLSESGAFHELRYESLCASPSTELVRLADFLGITADGFEFDLNQISNRNRDSSRHIPPGDLQVLAAQLDGTLRRKGYRFEEATSS